MMYFQKKLIDHYPLNFDEDAMRIVEIKGRKVIFPRKGIKKGATAYPLHNSANIDAGLPYMMDVRQHYNPNRFTRWTLTDVSCLLTVNLTSSHLGCRCILSRSSLEKPIGSFGIPRIPLRSNIPLLFRS